MINKKNSKMIKLKKKSISYIILNIAIKEIDIESDW